MEQMSSEHVEADSVNKATIVNGGPDSAHVASPRLTEERTLRRYVQGRFFDDTDEVAVEFPLTVRVNWEEFATLVCTPCDLEDLTLGFLASEGVILSASQVKSLSISEDSGFANVELDGVAVPGREFYAKRMIGSCCGKSREFYFVNDARTARTVPVRHQVSPDQCFAMMAELERLSEPFHRTGGVHNAALFGVDGCLAVRTDIGRHNALDKLFGYALHNRLKTADKTIAFSGRISSEVILKASKIGVGLLLSKSAPSDLALRLADDLGITAVGFIRGGKMNVYTHPERISEQVHEGQGEQVQTGQVKTGRLQLDQVQQERMEQEHVQPERVQSDGMQRGHTQQMQSDQGQLVKMQTERVQPEIEQEMGRKRSL